MDRETLDRLYNNRAAVPNHQQDIDRWEAASRLTRERALCRLDLPYGAHPRESFDLFTTAEPNRPLLVFIHGGYWQALDKSWFSFVADGFTMPAAGGLANVAVLNYPLAPEADMDRIVASIRRALVWLWREAAPLGFDPNRIYVTGHSAGGHLTAIAALTDWTAQDGAAPVDLVKGGVAISGLYDLLPIRSCYLNDRLRMTGPVAIRNSPQFMLPFHHGGLPPLAFAVGSDETAAFHGQQHDFVKAYAERGGQVTEVTAPGMHHFSIVHELARPDSQIRSALAAMMR
ncbi:alpha/beta hydrolase [Ferrovibrio sp.]|uniref:alpha/beta hydrolase n=1 Tax=Ferrovibrio sp. TaxID=1917215 RepID=UPI00311D8E47